ncbi:MAG: MliC family protein [Sphingomicrobium sp.]
MRTLSLIAAAATTALFAAGTANAASTKVKYDCKGGTVLTVTFKDGKARVSVPGAEPVMLSQGPSGDGFLYARKSYSLRGVGNKVTWSTGRGKPLTCKAR